MRRILIDRARARLALKRGGKRHRTQVDLDTCPEVDSPETLLDLNDVLSSLPSLMPKRPKS